MLDFASPLLRAQHDSFCSEDLRHRHGKCLLKKQDVAPLQCRGDRSASNTVAARQRAAGNPYTDRVNHEGAGRSAMVLSPGPTSRIARTALSVTAQVAMSPLMPSASYCTWGHHTQSATEISRPRSSPRHPYPADHRLLPLRRINFMTGSKHTPPSNNERTTSAQVDARPNAHRRRASRPGACRGPVLALRGCRREAMTAASVGHHTRSVRPRSGLALVHVKCGSSGPGP